MFLHVLVMIFGFILLIGGAAWLIDGATALARKYRVSDLAIGLTVVAFGTSAPELVVNAFASAQGHAGIVYGNIIGSNNFNLFVILGIAGLITPLAVQASTVRREIPFSFLAIAVLFLLTDNLFPSEIRKLSRIDGVLLMILFAFFLFYVFLQLKADRTAKQVPETSGSRQKTLLPVLAGLTGLIIGGRLVVVQAELIAGMLGVSDKIIGLTIVAAGTSLPELATSVIAALKKNNDIAVGNIVGSNIFNIFLILGVSALIRPIPYNTSFNTDLLMLSGGTVLLFIAMFTGQKRKLDRWEAGIFLVSYISYSFLLLKNA
ncbi:MAG: calcium/sodium antiporter [Candidatus Marinimicrobia bacterium]|nr:calcium/sodium antiporter [Candidatus Neomarinimicrobiota bacterium]